MRSRVRPAREQVAALLAVRPMRVYEVARARHVSRATAKDQLIAMVDDGDVINVGYGTYALTEQGRRKHEV
jgi:Mn-dependent DtxR family transcriptional regulator